MSHNRIVGEEWKGDNLFVCFRKQINYVALSMDQKSRSWLVQNIK